MKLGKRRDSMMRTCPLISVAPPRKDTKIYLLSWQLDDSVTGSRALERPKYGLFWQRSVCIHSEMLMSMLSTSLAGHFDRFSFATRHIYREWCIYWSGPTCNIFSDLAALLHKTVGITSR